MTAIWKCECGWEGDKPIIHAEYVNGCVVDVLEIMCRKCSKDPVLVGTQKEQDAWWKEFEKE